MIPGIDPKMMKQAMKRMGIKQQDIDAEQVIIRTSTKNIIINNPSVAKVNMMGQESFQISGEVSEESLSSEPDISEEDIKTVAEQTGKTEAEAEKAIKEAKGDLAAAILSLK